ncbi:MAG: hypothetical protein HEP80_09445 [Dolichospermum sp. UKL201]|jgi:hypothetical protein|nr:MAG: hypothetical protein HEP80_09445 [Dolichospermum sp. UKL201]
MGIFSLYHRLLQKKGTGNREQGANKKLYKCFIGIAIALLIPKSDRFFVEGWAIIAPFITNQLTLSGKTATEILLTELD